METDTVKLDLIGLFSDYPHEVLFLVFVGITVAFLWNRFTNP